MDTEGEAHVGSDERGEDGQKVHGFALAAKKKLDFLNFAHFQPVAYTCTSNPLNCTLRVFFGRCCKLLLFPCDTPGIGPDKMADFLLFEGPMGYSLFKVTHQGDSVGNGLKEVQEGVNDLAKFGKMVELSSFLPFEYALSSYMKRFSWSTNNV